MHQAFEITLNNRKLLYSFLKNYSLEQLNTIPEGFSNNLIWNIAHTVVVQQLLAYKLSGLPTMVSREMIAKYQLGTKPETPVTQEEIDEVRGLLFKTIEQTQLDYGNGVFKNFHEFTNSVGYTIRNIEDAIAFNYYHEATHLGIMMSIRKFI